MRKLQTVMLALVAMFALSALLATVASAETTLLAEWLANGAAITTSLASETTGELSLEDAKAPIVGKAAVQCSGILVGTVGANGADTITEVLNLKKELIGALGGLALLGEGGGAPDCKALTGCSEGTAASPIEVFPVGLPWKSTLILMESGAFLDIVTATKVGYEVLCLVLGINTEDECTEPEGTIPVQNNGTTGDAETPSGSEVTPDATCSLGGAGAGVNKSVGVATLALASGELLAVSSE